jgi:S1-C subfamily serine protease
MRRPARYSSSLRPASQVPDDPPSFTHWQSAIHSPDAAPPPGAHATRRQKISRHFARHNLAWMWSVIGLLALLLGLSLLPSVRPGVQRLTQKDINAAVLKTLESAVLPSAYAKAYDNILPSVVRVVGLGADKPGQDGKSPERSVGTGVVIVDKGVILTNLHVVQGATTIKVTFADGLESTASITGTQPENDLAVLQAHKIPDDLTAATMRSTAELQPGDEVLAVGYPFGIGPSASGGIISGLRRNFRSPEGKQELTNLIQFDAAANPGNSGGPLVTMDGEVIGIVTAIYNPNQQRTFVGIGFAVPIENAASAAGMPPF